MAAARRRRTMRGGGIASADRRTEDDATSSESRRTIPWAMTLWPSFLRFVHDSTSAPAQIEIRRSRVHNPCDFLWTLDRKIAPWGGKAWPFLLKSLGYRDARGDSGAIVTRDCVGNDAPVGAGVKAIFREHEVFFCDVLFLIRDFFVTFGMGWRVY